MTPLLGLRPHVSCRLVRYRSRMPLAESADVRPVSIAISAHDFFAGGGGGGGGLLCVPDPLGAG